MSHSFYKLPANEMRGCAFHFPLVEKCLCYPIFPLLEKHSGLPFEELMQHYFPYLAFWKKVPKSFPGPGLGDAIPFRWEKADKRVQKLTLSSGDSKITDVPYQSGSSAWRAG